MAQEQTTEHNRVQTYHHLQWADLLCNVTIGELLERHDQKRPYAAASLGKLYIAAATLLLAEDGQVDLQETLSITPDELGTIAQRPAELYFIQRTKLGIYRHTGLNLFLPTSLEGFLKNSVRNSDNLATLKVANHIGREKLQVVLERWGLFNTTILDETRGNPNVTTAEDMGNFLVDLGKGNLLEDRQADRLLGWMRKKHLPMEDGGQTALLYHDGHIIEEGLSYCHEAGYIIGRGSERFAYVVMTKDKADDTRATTYPQTVTLNDRVTEMAYRATGIPHLTHSSYRY